MENVIWLELTGDVERKRQAPNPLDIIRAAMKPQVAGITSLILTIALTLFMLFGPSYAGCTFGEYKHMNAIEVNGSRALVFLVPVGEMSPSWDV